MDPNLPFNFREVFQLSSLGLNPDLFKLQQTTFESQKYICVRDQNDCSIIDTQNNFSLEKKQMKAEGILMHRSQNIIALRATQGAKTIIQVFNLDTKQKVKQCDVAEPIRFWRWIDENDLGIVCKTGVFHTNINSADPPKLAFTLDAKFGQSQVMSYNVDPSKSWCALTGIYQGANKDICCVMQLYNTQKQQQQTLSGFISCFTQMPVTNANTYKNSLLLFCEKKEGEQSHKLHVMEIGDQAPGQEKVKRQAEIQMQQEGDFPVLMHDCPKYGVVFILTKMGFLFMYEVSTASLLSRHKLTDNLCFVAARNSNTDGMITINRIGQIFSINVQEQALIPFINSAAHIPNNRELSFKLAQRFHLPGADELFVQLFNQKLTTGDYNGAAIVARDAPGTLLRNQDTINKFKSLPQTGGPAPLLVYFNSLLQTTKLNAIESVELARPVIAQNKLNLIENWIKEGKLTMTDELGDLIRQANPQMALQVYQQSGGSPEKVIQGFIETNQLDKIMPYCQQAGYMPDFIKILRQIMPMNPQACVNLAKMVCNRDQGPPKADAGQVMDVFLEYQRVQECTTFLVQVLGKNRQDEGHLQTKLFLINLSSDPNVAEGIFKMNTFTYYDRDQVANYCEKAGLYGRALQNYTNMNDIKRVILNVAMIPEEQIMETFGRFSEDDSLQVMYDLLRNNPQNDMIVAKIAIKYASKLDQKKCVEVLESLGSKQGLMFFLMHVLPHTQDQDIFFKYIEACAKMGNTREVDRVIQETSNYDPIQVRDFLMEGRLQDPRPLIHLCNKHGYIEELTRHLYNNQQNRFIEIFLMNVNQDASPKVLGTLLELNCDDVYIVQLLNTIRKCPIDELVSEFECKGKLKMLRQWLEHRKDERIQDPALHNALAKIYIEINNDPQKFLIENEYYDSKIIGKYCEERNPDLAYTAYKRAWGECDNELINVTNKNFLFRLQARYLVERQDEQLWGTVLDESNEQRSKVIDMVITHALPESNEPEQVSCTVKAFMTAGIQDKLIELLEKIVLHKSSFSDNENLQNLLILTAIKSKLPQLKDYIQRLNNYNYAELAMKAQDDQYQLYEEAFLIYKKYNMHIEAITVLLYKMDEIKKAQDYVEKCNTPDVWFLLGQAYLDKKQAKEAIDCFMKAKNPKMYERVIALIQELDEYIILIPFLNMARQTIKDKKIDNEIIFSYAKCGDKFYGEIEYFISEPNQANILSVGDRCFQSKLYQPAKILYSKYGNQQALAQTHVMLKDYSSAYDAAKKADIPKVWKAVCFACIRNKEFNFAALCGLKVIIHPDHLETLIREYEKFGYTQDLIDLLEQGTHLEQGWHNGINTEMAICLVKHKPDNLKEFILTNSKKLQIPKLINVCEQYQLWPEVVELNVIYEQYDQAVKIMMQHSPSCFHHETFASNLVRVSGEKLYYDAMLFYLEEEPMLLNKLLIHIKGKLDLSKTVETIKSTGHINLIEDFLKNAAPQNNAAVNEALNNIYLEKQDYESLTHHIEKFKNFESGELAQKLEFSELLDLRRVSAILYKKNEKYEKSLEVAMKDNFYKEAMQAVAESKNTHLAEILMKDIIEKDDKELFAAMLFTCYELIKPDVALELAWRNDLMEFVMPFFIQFVKDLSQKVESVEKNTDHIKKKEEKQQKEMMQKQLDPTGFGDMGLGMMGQPQQLAIMPGMPGGMPGMPGGMGGMPGMPGGMGGMPPNMGGMGGPPGMGGMGGPNMGNPGGFGF